MSEVWMYAIPITIASAGFFNFVLAQYFQDSDDTPLLFTWLGCGFLLMLTAVYSVHAIALDTLTPPVVATRVAYIIMLADVSFSLLYLIIRGIQHTAKTAIESGTKWQRNQ